MSKIGDLNTSRVGSTCITQSVGSIMAKVATFGSSSIVIDLKTNDVDIKTDGEKISIVIKRKEATPEIQVQEQLSSIQVGQVTDDEMRRFNLGPYSKKSTPGSISV